MKRIQRHGTKRQPGYSYREAAAKIGAPERTIQHYTSQELIEPIIRGEGRGSSTRYSGENLVEIFVIRQLANYLLLTKIAKIMKRLKEMEDWKKWIIEGGPKELRDATIIVYNPKDANFRVNLTERPVTLAYMGEWSAVAVNVGEGFKRAFGG